MVQESEVRREDIKSPSFIDSINDKHDYDIDVAVDDNDWYMPNGGFVILNFYTNLTAD